MTVAIFLECAGPSSQAVLLHFLYFHILDHAIDGVYFEALNGVVFVIADNEDQLSGDFSVGQSEDLVEIPVFEDFLVQLIAVVIQDRQAKAVAGDIVV